MLIVCKKGAWEGTLRLPLLLRQAGAEVHSFSPAGAPVRRSIYLSKRFTAASDADLVPALRRHLATQSYEAIVLSDEPTLLAVVAARDPDPAGHSWIDGWFPVADIERDMPVNTSKAAFALAAPVFGVPIPESRVCHCRADIDTAVAALDCPVMFKTSVGFGGNGVIKINSVADVEAAFAALRQRLPVVVQRFVPGQLGSTMLLFDHGDCVYWHPSYKHVVFPEPFGPSCVRRLVDQPGLDAMAPIAKAVGRMTGFHGMAGIDWIETAPGEFAVLEFNPRPTPTMHFDVHSGVSCAAAWRALLAGRRVEQTPRPPRPGREIVYMFPQHLRRTIKMREWRELRRWIPFTHQSDIPWREPLMLAGATFGLIKLAFRQFRKRQNPGITKIRPVPAAESSLEAV